MPRSRGWPDTGPSRSSSQRPQGASPQWSGVRVRISGRQSSSTTARSLVVKPPPGHSGGRLCERPIAWRPFWWVFPSRPDGPSRLCCRARAAAVGPAQHARSAPPVRPVAARRRRTPTHHYQSSVVSACRPCARDRSIRARRANYILPWSRTANPPAPVARALAVPVQSRHEWHDARPLYIGELHIPIGPAATLSPAPIGVNRPRTRASGLRAFQLSRICHKPGGTCSSLTNRQTMSPATRTPMRTRTNFGNPLSRSTTWLPRREPPRDR